MRTNRRFFRIAPRALVGGLLLAGALASAADGPAARPRRLVDADLRFAGEMARRGLWREALFRWDRVLGDRPTDPRILNNIAVAAEALGEFDRAREAYSRALELSRDEKIAANYELFLRHHPEAAAGEAAEEGEEP